MKKFLSIICVSLPLCGIFFVFLLACPVFAVTGSNFQIKILAVCGNDAQEWNEDCDGEDLGVGTCITEGFNSGSLSCQADCSYDTSNCVIVIPETPPSGGGGSGDTPTPSVISSVIFSGRAYPGSRVILLKDAQLAVSTVAGPDARFYISLSGISSGGYTFSIYSEDAREVKSSLLNFSVSVTAGATTEISGIFIAPTIAVDKSQVRRGDNLAIFGQSVPGAEVTILINSEEEKYIKTATDQAGVYLFNLDTTELAEEQHLAKAKAAYNGEITPFGRAVSFLVSDKNILTMDQQEWLRGDLNEDWRVNLVDFSIGAYWYKKDLNEKIIIKEGQVLNGDGKIDLVDFSIMAYYWTG